jgi:hypothetical protein
MLVDCPCRLGPAVAFGTVEVQSGDGMLAESAFEADAKLHRFGGVVAHNFNVLLLSFTALGNRPTPFGHDTVWHL